MTRTFLTTARSAATPRSVFLLCLMFASVAQASENFWKDTTGKPAPDTEFRKTKQDFGGWLVVSRRVAHAFTDHLPWSPNQLLPTPNTQP